MIEELCLKDLSPRMLHEFAISCVEHVLGPDTPELCRHGLGVKREWVQSNEGHLSTLSAFRKVLAASAESAKISWLDSGIPAMALRATLAAMGDEAEHAALKAAHEARKLAAQRGFARSRAASSRERGDSADEALEQELRWQKTRLREMRWARPEE